MARLCPSHRTWVLIILFLYVSGTSSAQAATSAVWEITPYRIQFVLWLMPEPELTPRLKSAIEAKVMERAEKAVGAAWDMSAEQASPELAAKMLSPLNELDFDALPPALLESDADELLPDKLLLCVVRVTDGGYRIEARDYDLHARLSGSATVRSVPQRELLADEVFQAVLSAFAPLARVEKVEDKAVALRLRAASLPPIDQAITFVGPGDVFRPVLRFNDRSGKLRKLMPIDWTYLMVERVSEVAVDCQLYSGLRSPLTSRRRGNIESLAVLVRPTGGATEIELRSRMILNDPKTVRPMAGYAIYAHPAGSPETVLVGRTDGDGELRVLADDTPVRILLVKHGGEPLARLPIVPGLFPRLKVDITDDDQRLMAEGIIVGLQERFVDLVARRQVFITKIRALLEDNKAGEAKPMLEELRTMGRQEDWINEIRIQKQRAVADDKKMQKKIDKLFDDTEQVIIRYLNSSEVEKLDAEIKAKSR